MDDHGLLLLLCLGFLGVNSFGAETIVQKYTTEIFVQKRSRVVLDCSIRTQHEMFFTWTKDGEELITQKQRAKDRSENLPQRRRFDWSKNARELKSQGRIFLAENGSLIIDRVVNKKKKGISDEGFYECVGDSAMGTVIGRRVNLRIERPAFTIIPQDVAAKVGGTARFQCQVNLGSVLYDWRPLGDSHVQLDNSRITSFTGIFQLSNLTEKDAGTYICQAIPKYDKTLDIMEKTATLTISEEPLPIVPQFLDTSQNLRVRMFDPALLECLVEGQRPYKLTWFKGGSPVQESKRVTIVGKSNIKFQSTNSSDTGKYTCVLEVGDEVFQRVYSLDVLVPPKITTAPRPIANKLLVQRTRWSCIAEGHPAPNISWFKDGLKLYPAPTLQIKSELVLHGQFEDSGYYQCLAENEAGVDVATAYIRFNRKPDTPDKPRNVKAIPVSATEVNVTWSPAATQGGFDVMAYGVDFHEVHELTCSGKCAHLFDRMRDVSKGNFKVIGDLKPFTFYSFAVQGYSGNGAGLLSGAVIVRTLEAVPTAIPNIQIAPDTSTSFRVTWTEIPIEHRHGVIDRYQLTHGTREKRLVRELSGDTRSFLITGLKPDTTYGVRVLAGNAAGYPHYDINKEPWVEYRTPRASPSVHPTPKLTFGAVNYSSVLIKWNCNEFFSVGSYRITVQKLLESSAVGEINIPSESCQFLLPDLENNTFYKIEFMVKDREDKAIGVVTESYQSLAPGMTQQPPPPMDVDLQLLTSSEITLSWRKPRTSMKITKYTVMYRKRTDERNIYYIESATLTTRLGGLSPFTWYVIAVKSHSQATEGPFSKPVIVQTKEGIPSPPENLLAEVVSPGTVRLQWGPPKNQNGIIRFYIIYYNVNKDQPDTVWSSIQQNASTTTVVVQDLRSKIYYFKMRACTGAGEGKTSHIVAIDTLACSQTPCPQCQPPQDCSSGSDTEDTDDVVSNIMHQKIGIIIGCAIGLICIIICVFIVIKCRRVSTSSRHPQSGTLSPSCSDDVQRYLGQPVRHENGGCIRYSPIMKALEENKNSDTKGGDYIFKKGNESGGERMIHANDVGIGASNVPSQVTIGLEAPLSVDEREDQASEYLPNQIPEATERSPFLEPSNTELNGNNNLRRNVDSEEHKLLKLQAGFNGSITDVNNFDEACDNATEATVDTSNDAHVESGGQCVDQMTEDNLEKENANGDDQITSIVHHDEKSSVDPLLKSRCERSLESRNFSNNQVNLENIDNELDPTQNCILGNTASNSESKNITRHSGSTVE